MYGVTLMAFGNGGPDIFAVIAAFDKMKDGDVGVGMGSIMGTSFAIFYSLYNNIILIIHNWFVS